MNIKLSLFIALFTITNNITSGPIRDYLIKELEENTQQIQAQPQLSPREFYQQNEEKQTELQHLISKQLTLIGVIECINAHDLSETDAAEKCYDFMLRGAKISKSRMKQALEQSRKEWL